MLKLGEPGLKEYIKTIGLYNTKAKNVIAASKILVEQHRGKVPDQREALEALPGVGRKTANVILNTAFGQPTIAVDTHIFRVSNRTGIAPGKNVNEVEQTAQIRSGRIQAGCAPLADTAWPLYLHRTDATLWQLRHRGFVRIPAEDGKLTQWY